jgi:hypothetical protein
MHLITAWNHRTLRVLAAISLALGLSACQDRVSAQPKGFENDPMFSTKPGVNGEEMLGASIPVVGVHHYGPGHNIGAFSVNGNSCGNAGRPDKNSGSDTTCYVPIPAKWRPGIKLNIKWGVNNWNEDYTALQKGNAGRWYEAVAELEPYISSTGAVEVHFWADNTVRLVPHTYGPPDSDTDPKQTPPLTELPVVVPEWASLGDLLAIQKHEVPMPKDMATFLKEYLQHKSDYYAFLQRLWTSRGLTAEQQAPLLAKEQDQERRGTRSGYLIYLDRQLSKRGFSKDDAWAEARKYRNASQEELDSATARYMQMPKRK